MTWTLMYGFAYIAESIAYRSRWHLSIVLIRRILSPHAISHTRVCLCVPWFHMSFMLNIVNNIIIFCQHTQAWGRCAAAFKFQLCTGRQQHCHHQWLHQYAVKYYIIVVIMSVTLRTCDTAALNEFTPITLSVGRHNVMLSKSIFYIRYRSTKHLPPLISFSSLSSSSSSTASSSLLSREFTLLSTFNLML